MVKKIVIGLALAFLAVGLVVAFNQDSPWQAYMDAGKQAYERGNYPEAEKQLGAALKEAEGLGPEHPDVAQSLNNLAALYRAQGKYAEAEPLYKRSLAIWEKALGPEHTLVAQSLENLAHLLRKTGRGNEAAKLEARAKAIRAKRRGQNPAK